MTIAHVWPGITPLTVWDLDLSDWCMFAMAADAWRDQAKKTSSETGANVAGRRRRPMGR